MERIRIRADVGPRFVSVSSHVYLFQVGIYSFLLIFFYLFTYPPGGRVSAFFLFLFLGLFPDPFVSPHLLFLKNYPSIISFRFFVLLCAGLASTLFSDWGRLLRWRY